MMLKKSLKRVYGFSVGERLKHPVFGEIVIIGIYERMEEKQKLYDLACELVEFNLTVRVFDAMDMVRLRHQRKTRLRLVK